MNEKIKRIEINKIKKAKKMTEKDKDRLLSIGLSIAEVEKLEQTINLINDDTVLNDNNLLSNDEIKQIEINKLIKRYKVTDTEVAKFLNVTGSAITKYNNQDKKLLMKMAICYLKANDLMDCDLVLLLSSEKIKSDLKDNEVKKQDIIEYLGKNSGTFYQYSKEKQALFILGYLFLVKNSLI